MSYRNLVYHVVISTKKRVRTIEEDKESDLYAYLAGTIKGLGGFAHVINGMPDHVHLLVDLPATISVADAIKVIKQHSSVWLGNNADFPRWDGWSKGYAAFTCSPLNHEGVMRYVRNQKEHHKKTSFEEELKGMLLRLGTPYNDKDML